MVGNRWWGNPGEEMWFQGRNLCVWLTIQRDLEIGSATLIKAGRWSCGKKMDITEAPENDK